MEGLGTLAGGIAHDFITFSRSFSVTPTNWKARTPPNEFPAAIKVIKEAVDRGAALVQQLLTSARQTEARFSSVHLNALVRTWSGCCRRHFPRQLFPSRAGTRSSPHHCRQKPNPPGVAQSLRNARDAMPNGGTLTLHTSITAGADLTEMFHRGDGGKLRVRSCARPPALG